MCAELGWGKGKDRALSELQHNRDPCVPLAQSLLAPRTLRYDPTGIRTEHRWFRFMTADLSDLFQGGGGGGGSEGGGS